MLSLIGVGKSSNEGLLFRYDTVEVSVDSSVRSGVFGWSVSSIKNSSDLGSSIMDTMSAPVSEILRQPAFIDHNAAGLLVLVQMGVEGNDHVVAFLSVFDLVYFNFICHVVDSSDFHGFERPVFFELVDIFSYPGQVFAGRGSDVDRSFFQCTQS